MNTTKRFFGKVGYVETVEDDYGVSRQKAEEFDYYGDVVSKYRSKWKDSDKVNDDIVISHQISIVADGYANRNFPYIKYVEWMGARWNVTTIELEPPRIILTLGGVYNGIAP